MTIQDLLQSAEFQAAVRRVLGVPLETRADGFVNASIINKHNGYRLQHFQNKERYKAVKFETATAMHPVDPIDKVDNVVWLAPPLAMLFCCDTVPGFSQFLKGLVCGIRLLSPHAKQLESSIRAWLGAELANEICDGPPAPRVTDPPPTATALRHAIVARQEAQKHDELAALFQRFDLRNLQDLPYERYTEFYDGLQDIGLRSLQALGLSMRSASVSPSATTEGDDPSAGAVVATDGVVRVFDAATFRVIDEILLPDGGSFPDMCPLLNSHHRQSCADVLGGACDFRRDGSQWIGRALFDGDDPEAMRTYGKVEKRYIKSVSIGYRVLDAVEIRPHESAEVDGKKYTAGPDRVLRIAKRWQVFELSVTPIGADQAAKFRNATEPLKGDNYERAAFVERARILSIHAMAAELNDSTDLRSKAIAAGWTPDRYGLAVVRSQALAKYDN